MLHYYSDLLREMIDLKILYREKEVQLPAPQFVVFYNGRHFMAGMIRNSGAWQS